MLQPNYVEMIHGTAFPTVPFERQLFYRDDLHIWYIYNGAVWVSLQGDIVIHGNLWHAPAFATQADLLAHIAANVAGIHGSDVLATPNRLIHRDAAGRAQIANPAANPDIDNMGSRAAADAAEAAARAAADAAHTALTTNVHGIVPPANIIGSPLVADLNFAHFMAIAMACDQGPVLPALPVRGQWFLHTPVGRQILMPYDGTTWVSIITLGSMTVYVDNTDGTDNQNQGGAVDAGAFKTIQYAVNQIPPLFSGNVFIYINNESYFEKITIQGKNPTGNFSIYLIGTRNIILDTSATGGSGGTGATRATVVRLGAGWGINAYQYKFIKFKDDTVTAALRGVVRPILSNTADTLTLCGTLNEATPAAPPPAPVNGDTFEIFNNASIIDGGGAGGRNACIIIGNDQKSVILRYLHLQNTDQTSDTTYCINNPPFGKPTQGAGAMANLQGCSTDNRGGVSVMAGNGLAVYSSIIRSRANQNSNGALSFWNTLIYPYVAGGIGILAADASYTAVKAGTTIWGAGAGTGQGLYALGNAIIYTDNGVNEGYAYIAGWAIGCYALIVSAIRGTVNNQYIDGALTNTANETAVAASFGYID